MKQDILQYYVGLGVEINITNTLLQTFQSIKFFLQLLRFKVKNENFNNILSHKGSASVSKS